MITKEEFDNACRIIEEYVKQQKEEVIERSINPNRFVVKNKPLTYDNFDMSARLYKCLKSNGIHTIYCLQNIKEEPMNYIENGDLRSLFRIRNFGRATMKELLELLLSYDLIEPIKTESIGFDKPIVPTWK